MVGVFAKQERSEPDLSIQEGETRKGAVLSDPGLACKYTYHPQYKYFSTSFKFHII